MNKNNIKVQILGNLLSEFSAVDIEESHSNSDIYKFSIPENYKESLQKEYIYIPPPPSRGKNKVKKY